MNIDFNKLWKDNNSFAAWRAPQSKDIQYIVANQVTSLHNMAELHNQQGFVLTPFVLRQDLPIVLVQGDVHTTPQTIVASYQNEDQLFEDTNMDESYAIHFGHMMDQLQADGLDKVVLARKESHTLPVRDTDTPSDHASQNSHRHPIDITRSFLAAANSYPNSFIYLVYTPQTGLWMGCTPEILLSGTNHQYSTISLAGTQSLPMGDDAGAWNEMRLEAHWDKKNIHEQALVTTYIRERLQKYATDICTKGPYTSRAGQLAHLKTTFSFKLASDKQLSKLLSALHPTPAVCGYPQAKAMQCIAAHEELDRKYYSGFIGYTDGCGSCDFFVNLRCMEIEQNTAHFYAGGGLLPSSHVEKEYQETVIKMQTIKKIIYV